MAAIGRVEGAGNRRGSQPPEPDGPPRSTLDRLQHRDSAIARLLADAGPLGKFRTDVENALPSGTSALTARIADTLVRVASRFDMTIERLLPGNPQLLMLLAPIQPTVAQRIEAAAASIAAVQAVAGGVVQPLAADPLAIAGRPIVTDTALDGARMPLELAAGDGDRAAAPPPQVSDEGAAPASGPVEADAAPDVLAVLRNAGLVDLMADPIAPIESAWDAPAGAIMLYRGLDGESLALELRTPGGFASETIETEPLSVADYRLIAVFRAIEAV